MGLRDFITRKIMNATTRTAFKMITEQGNAYASWDGKIYNSDIVRSCIRPFAAAVGKLTAKHVRRSADSIMVNPEVYIRFLLEEPNPYMSGHVMQEKLACQLMLNNNAFCLIVRDENGLPQQLYPIPAIMAEAVYDQQQILYLKFTFKNGKTSVFPYSEVIHLRRDFNSNDLFGELPKNALAPLMEVINVTDQGIVKAVKNSGVISWLLKYSTPLRPEDLKKNVQDFVDNYLSVSSSTFGAAGVDAKAEATRIEPKDYVPGYEQTEATKQRIYAFFNTNEKIVHSNYTEDEWTSYFEAVVEPLAVQMSDEFTRKIFSRRERGYGNKIYFDAANLQCASLQTRLQLQAMVDRGALTPNEWRATFNLAPVDGGDKPLRRLDTEVVNSIYGLMDSMTLENAVQIKQQVLEILQKGGGDGKTDQCQRPDSQ